MNNYSLLLTFLYVAIAALLLVLCLATGWRRWVKVLMIAVVTFSYFIANYTFEDMLGWPTPRMLPEKFLINGVVIEEPNKERGVEGAIACQRGSKKRSMSANRASSSPSACSAFAHACQSLGKIRSAGMDWFTSA